MADGEERRTLRPLRPAAPGAQTGATTDRPVSAVPRPRRPWLDSGGPADGSPTTGADAATSAPTIRAATPAPEQPAEPEPTADAKADPTAEAKPATTADGKEATRAVGEPTATTETATKDPSAKAETPTKTDGEAAATVGPSGTTDEKAGDGTGTRPPRARRRRVRFAHAVRVPGPRAAALATRDWSRRPGGRLTLPGVFLLALVIATATAGALVVPKTVGAPRPVAADATAGPETTDGITPLTEAPPIGAVPPGTGTLPPGATPFPGATGGTAPVRGRPSDALAGWAGDVGAKTGIDPIAVQAYGYAELVLAETNRACGLSWTTLAAIGFVESRHGQANNARLGPDGRATPEIIGLPLDGQGGRMRIADTDRGELDRDTTYDRAVGPMQFIPTTWEENGADADGDGIKDPHNIHDAALAAGMYLCKGGRNLTVPGDWWNAILSYNNVGRYAQAVFETANRYGQASRT
ncbi:lytic murein transglycosylase [Micromonospora sp. NPDC003816]|uniref:lytic transglycosylase domain-containing protein n=1 Tax=Micromonospora sp. NPDC003816 TaxID=3364224 RepID=UPI00367E3436